METITTKCGCIFQHGGWITATCEHGREFTRTPRLENDFWKLVEITTQPKIVCLCGSTRFGDAFQKANSEETLKGRIVLTIGYDTKSDENLFEGLSPDKLQELKERLDILHFRKIDMADEVIILNVDGYIGESTARELIYARRMGKKIRYLEREKEILEDIEMWEDAREN